MLSNFSRISPRLSGGMISLIDFLRQRAHSPKAGFIISKRGQCPGVTELLLSCECVSRLEVTSYILMTG